MIAKGTFEVKLEPQTDEFPAGRLTIDKHYYGDMIGTGKGQMISKRTESGHAVYSAIEEVDFSIEDKKGGFTLHHNGKISKEGQLLSIEIVEGSGFGDFKTISGSMSIVQTDGNHHYELNYHL
jgi:hypothetical protein